LKQNIKRTAYCAIFSALCVTLITVGTLLEIFDITVAAVCSFITYISLIEFGTKSSILVFFTSCDLSFIVIPSVSTAFLYYTLFFGYYPILKKYLSKLNKYLATAISTLLFTLIMILLVTLFRKLFGLLNEPLSIYITLILVSDFFFIVYDYAINIFAFLYIKKFRKIFKI
jgi:hypothetical protein